MSAFEIVAVLAVSWFVLGIVQYFIYFGWLRRSGLKLIAKVPNGTVINIDEYVRRPSVCVVDALMEDGIHYIFTCDIRFVEFMVPMKKMLARIMARRYGASTARKLVSVYWFHNPQAVDTMEV